MGNEVFSKILKGKIWDDILPCTYKLRKRNALANFGQTHDLLCHTKRKRTTALQFHSFKFIKAETRFRFWW